MGIFSSKPKVNMESFCKDYYDSQMFHALVGGEDASQKILNAAYKLLANAEPLFSKVDRDIFEREMTAMNLELFSLAFSKRFSKFDNAVQQCIFTFRYLQDKRRNDIWESMAKYSITIAQTATMNAKGEHMTGDTAIGRATITRVNTLRDELFTKWLNERSYKPDNLTESEKEIVSCVAHASNHVEGDILRNNELGNKRISALFMFRLGAEEFWGKNWQPSEDFLLRVASQSYSMYEFANKALKTVDIRFP